MGTSSTVLLQRGYLQTNSYLAVSSALAWGAMYAHRVDELAPYAKSCVFCFDRAGALVIQSRRGTYRLNLKIRVHSLHCLTPQRPQVPSKYPPTTPLLNQRRAGVPRVILPLRTVEKQWEKAGSRT